MEIKVKIENGIIIEMDGKSRKDFDIVDTFIADYAIDISKADEAMKMSSDKAAQLLCDMSADADTVKSLFSGFTPLKLAEVIEKVGASQLVSALGRLSEKKSGKRVNIENVGYGAAMAAADAAECSFMGFDEFEVSNSDELTAAALLIGANSVRCGKTAVYGDSTENGGLSLATDGFTTLMDNVKAFDVQGAFEKNNTTPYSEAFLAAASMSRGMKPDAVCGSKSEKNESSYIYNMVRSVMCAKGMGVLGVRCGGDVGVEAMLKISAAAAAVGLRATAENADSGAMAVAQLAEIGNVTYYNGSNIPSEVDKTDIANVRHRAAQAVQAAFAEMGIYCVSDSDVAAAAENDKSRPINNVNPKQNITVIQLVDALIKSGYTNIADNIIENIRSRLAF